MRVLVDGRQYRVWFQHDLDHYHNHGFGRTTAFVGEGETLIALGIADCSIRDTFTKSKGRKVALARALRSVWPVDKYKRQQVWEGLFNSGMKA